MSRQGLRQGRGEAAETEIRGIQRHLKDFADDDIDVIGVSTDSFFSHSHKGLVRRPQDVSRRDHAPVLADTSHAISRALGVPTEEDGIAYCASVIVDDTGVIRACHVNETPVGRSPREGLRTAQALRSGGLCGADCVTAPPRWHSRCKP